ncbi:hypothetical protein A0256_13435 [Mucilaginibacter sp. PAMC 26640]|nr:hypothetical protein A0256_13435 [Mucilaginibacter sp. PAMC 26640]
MENHNGQIVEYVVRRNGYSITDLATELNVDRRSIYNYFQNRNLKYDVIYKIGLLLRHDFGKEFPELFNSEQFDIRNRQTQSIITIDKMNANAEQWKDKYIQLLEDYNKALRLRILNKHNQVQLADFN